MIKKSKELINKFLRSQNYEIKRLNKHNQKIIYVKKPVLNNELLEKVLFYRDINLVFKVPIKNCIMGPGFNCEENSNPMSLYLKHKDEKIIKNFYNRFRPNNISDALKLQNLNRQKISSILYDPILKYYYLPKFKGLTPLGFAKKDGHILNGPISRRLQNFEIQRINKIHKSISKKGWKPNKFKTGFIRGIFLIHKNEYLFKIIGGNHRAASLSVLKKKYLDCWFQPNEPRFVSSNFFKKNLLHQKIFKYYFDKKFVIKRKNFIRDLLND